jgi:hypothetical protein
MRPEFSQQVFEKKSYIKFFEKSVCGSRAVPCGQTDVTKLIVAFSNFSNAPTQRQKIKYFFSELYVYEMPYKCLYDRNFLCVPINHIAIKAPGLMPIPDPMRILNFSQIHKHFPIYPKAFTFFSL